MIKYFLLALAAHLILLAPLYFLRESEEQKNLNTSSVFVDVKEIRSSGPSAATEAGPVVSTPAPEENTSQPNAVSSPDGTGELVIRPDYPLLSRKFGEEGESTFLLNLDKDGSVLIARLEKSSGYSRLDDAARDALLKAKFPSTNESEKRFTVVFRLKNRP